jgi:YjbE family integral membrane protein
VLIDLVLSGDNAIVIGMAVRNLPPQQRRMAILGGTAGAIVLRITLTAITALLLDLPLLQAAGGLVLVWITYKLLKPSEEYDATANANSTFIDALRTIIIADVSMSIDNVLAVGAASGGDLGLLIFGLALSLMIIMAGASVVSVVLNRLPWLMYVGGLILLFLAGEMLAKDPILDSLLGIDVHALGWLGLPVENWLALAFTTFFTLIVGVLVWNRDFRGHRPHPAEHAAPDPSDHQAPAA